MTIRLQVPSELCCDACSRVPTSNEDSAWIDAVRTQRGPDGLDSLKQGGTAHVPQLYFRSGYPGDLPRGERLLLIFKDVQKVLTDMEPAQIPATTANV